MDTMFVSAAMSTPSLVLRYAAAFFFVVVAIFMAYALFKAAKALERVDKVLVDVDENGIPLMQKAGATLDGVNANLGNVDEITKDVAGITDKLDKMATSVEGAVTTPARKAAAFSAGVRSAVSSFMKRDQSDAAASGGSGAGSSAAGDAPPAGGWSYAAAPGEAAADAAEAAGDAATTASSGVADTATAAAEAVADAAADAKPDEA
jgi:uncharacterized protein YoxC